MILCVSHCPGMIEWSHQPLLRSSCTLTERRWVKCALFVIVELHVDIGNPLYSCLELVCNLIPQLDVSRIRKIPAPINLNSCWHAGCKCHRMATLTGLLLPHAKDVPPADFPQTPIDADSVER